MEVIWWLDTLPLGKQVISLIPLESLGYKVVYDILKKKEEGDLRDRSRAPLHSPYKTPAEIEEEAKNQTPLGAKGLAVYLKKYEKIKEKQLSAYLSF